jgi:hypothetical protein
VAGMGYTCSQAQGTAPDEGPVEELHLLVVDDEWSKSASITCTKKARSEQHRSPTSATSAGEDPT